MSERPILCRTCLRPIVHETRTSTGYLPRERWWDDAATDAEICFKAADYTHEPMTDRERAYWEHGYKTAANELAAPKAVRS